MSIQPCVSILLPVHNAQPFITACLQSISRQTYPLLDIVVVDDGSTDETLSLVTRAAAADQRIRVLSPGRIGLIAALNLGLQAGWGDVVARMDADDICRRDRIERQVQALRTDPALTLISCRTVSFPRSQVTEGFRIYEAWLNHFQHHEEIVDNFFIESPFAHPTVMFRKSAVLAAGGYRDCGWPEDYDLWLRLLAGQARFGKLPKTLLAWRMHSHRLFRSHPRYSPEAFFRLKCQILLPRLPRHVVVLGTGRVGRAWIKILQENGIEVVAALDFDPRRRGHSLPGVPIVSYEHIGDYAGIFILAAGSRHSQRSQMLAWLAHAHRQVGRDYLCVA